MTQQRTPSPTAEPAESPAPLPVTALKVFLCWHVLQLALVGVAFAGLLYVSYLWIKIGLAAPIAPWVLYCGIGIGLGLVYLDIQKRHRRRVQARRHAQQAS